MNREQHIQDILNSTSGHAKADPGPFFTEKVLQKLNTNAIEPAFVMSPFVKWTASVMVMLLVVVNVRVLILTSPQNNKTDLVQESTETTNSENDLSTYYYY